MRVVVISGRSGSGKSTALQALEDVGFYCIDNLPATLLPALVEQMTDDNSETQLIAVSIDARNLTHDLKAFPDIISSLRARSDIGLEITYLDASESTLLKRYSATRRKHPLSSNTIALEEAISQERTLLEPIASSADMRVDTTRLSLYELRDTIKLRVAKRQEQALSLQFESFGFKHGVPLDVDFSFDVRVLPNPYWFIELRSLTGKDEAVKQFLGQSEEVLQMVDDIAQFIDKWIPQFRNNNRSYVTVGIGCTGGQHRSVYIAETLAQRFCQTMENVQIRHRELSE